MSKFALRLLPSHYK